MKAVNVLNGPNRSLLGAREPIADGVAAQIDADLRQAPDAKGVELISRRGRKDGRAGGNTQRRGRLRHLSFLWPTAMSAIFGVGGRSRTLELDAPLAGAVSTSHTRAETP